MDLFGIDIKSLGAGTGVLAVLATILYKAYQVLKQDSKGDKVDGQVQQLLSQLRDQLDKAILRADTLQNNYNALQLQFAEVSAKGAAAQARVEFLASENQQLRSDLQVLRNSLQGVVK